MRVTILDLLQFTKRAIGAVMHAKEAGLVAGDQRYRARIVEPCADGFRHMEGWLGIRELFFDFQVVAPHFQIDEIGFGDPDTADAPAG